MVQLMWCPKMILNNTNTVLETKEIVFTLLKSYFYKRHNIKILYTKTPQKY